MSLENLHVIALEVENVMRVRVAKLAPRPGLNEVAGNNGNGKTSLLDAIAMALGGKDEIPWQPVHKGEDAAMIRLDLGNGEGLQLRVTRKFRAKPGDSPPYTTTLKVELANGARPPGETTLLKSLVSGLSFDPQAFMDARPEERIATLKGLVPGFDFDANFKAWQDTYNDRTVANRETKRLEALVASMPIVPASTPAIIVDTSPMIAKMAAIGEATREYEKKKIGRQQFIDANAEMIDEAEALATQASHLRSEAERHEAKAASLREEVSKRQEGQMKWPALVPPESPAAIQDAIAAAERVNADVRRAAERKKAEDALQAAGEVAKGLSTMLERLKRDATDALDDASLPSGLTIEDGRVLLRGVPFEQGSTAEQMRCSLAIGMSLNPSLKVMRIRHGALLDDAAMALIESVAEEEGFQIWAETVSPRTDHAIIMEEGEIKR